MTEQLLLACGCLTTLHIPDGHDDNDDGQRPAPPQRQRAATTAMAVVVAVAVFVGFVVGHGFCRHSFLLLLLYVIMTQ